MATVRASCSGCGDVELTTREVQVQVCSATEEGTYSFMCPSCRLIVNKPAEPRVIELLVSAGREGSQLGSPGRAVRTEGEGRRSLTTTCWPSTSS